MFLERLGLIAFFLMLCVGLMLPSDGNHGLLSPKSLAFLSAAATALLYAIVRYHYTEHQLWLTAQLFSAFTLLFVWLSIGIYYGESYATAPFDQCKIFAITLISAMISSLYIQSGALTAQQFICWAIYINAFYSLIKLSAALLHITGIMDILTFMKTTGFRLMSMDIHGGMIRLQTSVDIITPFLLLFVLQRKTLQLNLNRWLTTIYIHLSLISIFLSFSRYLMAVAAIAFFFHWITLSMEKKFKGILLVFIASMLFATAIGWETIYKVIEKRLYSNDNYYSDKTRTEQIEALTAEAACYPFLGKGLGAYSPTCIRDHTLPYSYEVQWVAFTMQLGTLGAALLLFLLLAIGWRYLTAPFTEAKAAFFLLYCLWLLSGFTNPFLISLTSGICYALFSAGAICLTSNQLRVLPQK